MQYLTYEEYVEIGGNLDLTAFKRNIDRACGFIRNETFNRIEKMKSIPIEVKPCCRDLVERISEQPLSSKSQTAGAVSESVTYAKTDDILDIIFDYLGCVENDEGIPLLYRGGGKY